jgi:GNAT superfamily N-acetyltransferase
MRRDLGEGIELDDDPGRIDLAEVHRFLSEESYWARGRPRAVQDGLVRASARVVGLYHDGRQIGFCRAVSDGAVIAYLADVYVLAGFRGRGLGEQLVRAMVEEGPLAGVRWQLHTTDMHRLYRKFGFDVPDARAMERPPRPRPAPG